MLVLRTRPMTDRLYFRQLLSGRDFAVGDMVASQMVNFVYLIGDRETGEVLVVDPAYAVADIARQVEEAGMKLAGGSRLPLSPRIRSNTSMCDVSTLGRSGSMRCPYRTKLSSRRAVCKRLTQCICSCR